MSKSIRISDEAKGTIKKMSCITGIPEIKLLDIAIKEFKKH